MEPLRKRRGVASVIGTMLFVIVLMAGLGAVAYVYSLQSQSTQAAQQAQQLLNQKGKESLTYQALSGGTLAVANAGSSGSTIKYVVLKFANGSAYQFSPNQGVTAGGLLSVPSLIPSQSCGLSTCLSKYNSILASTSPGNSIGLVTSLGNVFWLRPSMAVQSVDPSTTYQVTFDASGDSSFGSNNVVVVDGVGYSASQLPVTLTWFAGTQHSYAFQTLPQGSGTQVGIASVTGLEDAFSGTITASSDGTVRSSYTTQYLLAVHGGNGLTYTGGIGSCNGAGSCWYDAGGSGQVTTNNVWNVVSGQSRQDLYSWNLNGGSNNAVTQSGSGTWTSNPISMSAPQTLNLNSVTQYYVTASNNVPASGSLPALTVNYGYTGTQTIPQAAQNPSLSSWSPYWTETNSCSGCGGASWPSGGSFYESVSASSGNMYPTASSEIVQGLQTQMLGIPTSGVTYTSMTFSLSVSISTYLVGYGGASFCIWVGSSSQQCITGSGTLTATWSGSSQAVPSIYAEASASAISYSCGPGYTQTCYGYAVIGGSASSASWSVTYTGPVSGSTQSTSNGYSVSGGTVTYTYGVGYSYPVGSSAMSWSASWPSTETYLSNTCSSVTSTANPIAASPTSTAATCTLTTTQSGTYSVSLVSPTNDGWFNSGGQVWIAASTTGAFSFVSWSSSSGSIVLPSGPSGYVTIGAYGTITANCNVNQ